MKVKKMAEPDIPEITQKCIYYLYVQIFTDVAEITENATGGVSNLDS